MGAYVPQLLVEPDAQNQSLMAAPRYHPSPVEQINKKGYQKMFIANMIPQKIKKVKNLFKVLFDFIF